MRRAALFLPIAAFAALVACDAQGPAAAEPEAQADAGPVKGVDRSNAGTPAPDITLADAEGAETTLASAAGEPVLVNLWATWCAPCIKELPTLAALDARDGAPRVIAVSQDMAPRGSVDAFLERQQGLEALEVWHDPEMGLSGGLGAEVLPTTILYGADGREVWRYVGDLDWTSDEALKLIAETAGRQG